MGYMLLLRNRGGKTVGLRSFRQFTPNTLGLWLVERFSRFSVPVIHGLLKKFQVVTRAELTVTYTWYVLGTRHRLKQWFHFPENSL